MNQLSRIRPIVPDRHDPGIAAPLSRDEALARARALAPAIKRRAAQAIAERQAPVETIDELKAAGLLRLLQPRKYGGSEQGWDVFCEVIEILAEACGSQGWVYRVLGDHSQMLALFPAKAQDDVWGEDIDTLAASSFMPVGKAVAVPGGFRVSGKYSFSSGIDHAQWLIAGGRIPVAGDPAKTTACYFLVPRSEATVIDDWFVNGLEGSGSKSFEIKDVFVPEHRILDWDEAALGCAPGSRTYDAAIFRLPRGGYTTTAFAALAVGMARGMLDEWLDIVAKRRQEGKLVAALESTQITAGEAASEIDAARRHFMAVLADTMAALERGETMPPRQAMAARATASFACQLILAAANRLHASMGSSAVYKGPMLEHQFRNILVGLQHIGVNWPRAASGYGADLLRAHGADLPGG